MSHVERSCIHCQHLRVSSRPPLSPRRAHACAWTHGGRCHGLFHMHKFVPSQHCPWTNRRDIMTRITDRPHQPGIWLAVCCIHALFFVTHACTAQSLFTKHSIVTEHRAMRNAFNRGEPSFDIEEQFIPWPFPSWYTGSKRQDHVQKSIVCMRWTCVCVCVCVCV